MAKKLNIMLIAGHGEGDPGATSIWGWEMNYTRELATLVKKAFGDSANVTMYDQNKNCYHQCSVYGNVPDFTPYDYVLEIHFNAKGSGKDPNGDGRFTGVGAYVHPTKSSGKYYVEKKIIEKVVALGFKQWGSGVYTMNLCVARHATEQGTNFALLETAFIDDGDDMSFYTAHKNDFAVAIASAILEALGSSASAVIPSTEPMYRVRLTWKDEKSQIFAGTLEGAKRACLPGYSVYDEKGKSVYNVPKTSDQPDTTSGTTAKSLKGKSESEIVDILGAINQEVYKKTGVLASVSTAQSILESGYCSTDLALNANNIYGMKCFLSSNTWEGTTWDGVSSYRKETKEEYTEGVITTITADFRKYPCIEKSCADHAAYLLGAMRTSTTYRYPGIKGNKDFDSVVDLLVKGGYATDKSYKKKLKSICERFNLTRFDTGYVAPGTSTDTKSDDTSLIDDKNRVGYKYLVQVGVYKDLTNAKNIIKSIKTKLGIPSTVKKINGEYMVRCGQFKSKIGAFSRKKQLIDGGFTAIVKDKDGNEIKQRTTLSKTFTPYEVKVDSTGLRIRETPSLRGKIVKTMPKGIFTIVEEKVADNHTWGLLKSYATKKNGWIALDYASITKLK